MKIGWVQYALLVALFVVVGAYFNSPLWLSGGLGLVCAGGIGVARWWRNQNRSQVGRSRQNTPFDGKLPADVGMATIQAVALEGDESYGQRVEGVELHGANFEDLRQYAQVADNSTLEIQLALVNEPAHRERPFAVAVTAGGVVLGYVPLPESETLYNFLLNHEGMARANGNVHIAVARNANRVELDLVRPYRVVPGV